MKKTGQKLKEQREAARLTISEVSLATKINPKVLSAMESGNVEQLPAKTFLRGFVRSYANFLKMNVDEILAMFKEETEEALPIPTEDEAEISAAAPSARKKIDVNSEGGGMFRLFIVGGILVLIAVIMGIRTLMHKYEREKATANSMIDLSAAKITPIEQKKEPDGSDADNRAVAGDSSMNPNSEDHDDNADNADADNDASETDVSPVVSGTDSRVPASKQPRQQVASPQASSAVTAPIAPIASTAPSTPASPTPQVKAVKAKVRHEIILEALDKVKVQFSLHGQNKMVMLTPNQVHTIYADEPVTLNISDGGALNLTDNGRDRGAVGDLGHPKQITIP